MSLTSVIRYVRALDSSATDGSGKTGLAFGSITAKYLLQGGTLTALTTETITTLGTYQAPSDAAHIRVKELNSGDPTKGVYEVHFHNTQVAASGKKLWLFLSASGAAFQPLEFDLITYMDGDAAAAGNLKTSFDDTPGPVPWTGITDQGTAQSASATTLVLRSAAAFGDNTLHNSTLWAFGSTQGYWQSRSIISNVGSTDTVTVDAWTVTPTGTITYKIFGSAPAPSSGALTQVDVRTWLGTPLNAPATAGVPDVNVQNWGNVVADGMPLAASAVNVDEQGRIASRPEAFGIGGRAVFPKAGTNQFFSVAPQGSNNGIMAAGWADVSGHREAALAQLNVDSSLDTTFGGGFVYTTFATFAVWNFVLVQDADQKVIVMGYSGLIPNRIWSIRRYNTTGTLDVIFDDPGFASDINYPFIGVLQTDGKLLSAGFTGDAAVTNWDFAIARHNTNGTLDTLWNGTGRVTTNFGFANEQAHGVVVQTDGKVVAAGFAVGGGICMARYDTLGMLDPTFGTAGKVITSLGTDDDQCNAMAIQSDGKIVLGGYKHTGNTRYQIVVLRYDTLGVLDPTFDGTGIVVLDFNSGGDEILYGQSLDIQPDGKILVGGYVDDGVTKWMVAARLNTDGSLDDDPNTGYGYDGKSHVYFTQGPSVVTGGVLRKDGKLVLCGYVIDPSTSFDSALALLDQNGHAASLTTQTETVTLSTSERDAVASAVLDLTDGVETDVTLRQATRAMAAILAGIVSGAGSGTEVFKSIRGSTTRVTVTVDTIGNRSAVSFNL